MRVKNINAFVLAFVLCLSSFTLFSFADGEDVAIKDSGSPEVSLKALRSIAADEGISLAAAEGDSGQFGYNIEPYQGDFSITYSDYSSSSGLSKRAVIRYAYVEPGSYSWTFKFDHVVTNAYWRINSTSQTGSYRADSKTVTFNLDISEAQAGSVAFTIYSPVDSFDEYSELTVLYESAIRLVPVEGISSGYTYSSGILERSTRSIFESFDADFGSQPAGKYLVNIYHWGDSYDVRFQISDSSESYYLPTSTNGSVTTLVYNHPGGQFTLDGSFTASNVETSVADGYYLATNYNNIVGDFDFYGPLSWVFNIKDIVAIPYDQAADHNFGFFAPIIGFFNDHFSSMKSFIAEQIDKIAGDDETKSDVDDAQSELQKEVEDLNNLSGQLDTQASNLEQQFTTDFAIPDTVSGQGSNFQSIYTSLFGSLGVFGIFIWLPIVMAVIKKLLRL